MCIRDSRCINDVTVNFITLLYKKNWRFYFAVHLFSNKSQMMSKCGKGIMDTLTQQLVCHFLNCYWIDALQHGMYLLNSATMSYSLQMCSFTGVSIKKLLLLFLLLIKIIINNTLFDALNAGSGISELLIFEFFRGRVPPDLPCGKGCFGPLCFHSRPFYSVSYTHLTLPTKLEV